MTAITSDTLLLNTDRHARVDAGPGAGKTYWIAEHVKNVLQRSKKIHSYARIAVISYTNIAADELRQKLGGDAAKADIGTIHNFLYRNVISKRPKFPSGVVAGSVADSCRYNEVSTCFQVDTSSTSVW
jgi:DNA helicase-2/ATP-dependent DNA helicase PcrA